MNHWTCLGLWYLESIENGIQILTWIWLYLGHNPESCFRVPSVMKRSDVWWSLWKPDAPPYLWFSLVGLQEKEDGMRGTGSKLSALLFHTCPVSMPTLWITCVHTQVSQFATEIVRMLLPVVFHICQFTHKFSIHDLTYFFSKKQVGNTEWFTLGLIISHEAKLA